MNYFRGIGLALLLLTSCVKQLNSEDLDDDGIPDSRDQCMADPEDMDGFEDDDGCPEEGHAPEVISDEKPQLPELDTGPDVRDVRIAAIKRGKTKPFAQATKNAVITPFQKKAWGTKFAPTRPEVSIIFGFGKAWLSVNGKKRLLRHEVYKAHFSPNGRRVALVTSKEFLVLDVDTGTTLRKFPYAKADDDVTISQEIRLISEKEAIYFDGCQLFRVVLTNKKRPTPTAKKTCGRPLTTRTGDKWLVWQQSDTNISVHQLTREGKPTKTPNLILGGKGNAPGLSLLQLSPNGRYLCFSRNQDGSEFTCRDLKLETDLVLWNGPTDKRMVFSQSGDLAFGGGAPRSNRTLYHVFLDRRVVRPLGKLGPKEKWLHAWGQDGFVASGGQRLLIFDISNTTILSIPLDSGEWEGLSVIPGETQQLILGKERRATRDLFQIQIK